MFTQSTQTKEHMNREQKVTISGVVFYVAANCKQKLMEQIKLIHAQNGKMTDERLAELLLEKLKEEQVDMLCGKMVEEVIQKSMHLRKPD